MEDAAPSDFLANKWDIIEMLLGALIADWGSPAQLAAQRFISRDVRRQILLFLIPIKALARRLLMIMAAALPKPVVIERKARPRRAMPSHGRANLSAEESSAWGVSFALTAPSPSRASGARRRRRLFAKTNFDSRPLAERIEALTRVLINPAPYAQRLLRTLHRIGKHAAIDQLMRPCRNGGRVNPLEESLEDSIAEAAPFILTLRDTS